MVFWMPVCTSFRKPFNVSRLGEKVGEALGLRDLRLAEDSSAQAVRCNEMDEELILSGPVEVPRELLDQLSRAAIEGNMSRMAAAVDSIREQNAALARVIACWLDRFQIEKIVRFVEQQAHSE